jgi:predicted ATPase with chaperone activity
VHSPGDPELPEPDLRSPLDRIDLQVTVPEVRHDEMLASPKGECSAVIAKRISEAANYRSLERDYWDGF